jgi:hypothetical protein
MAARKHPNRQEVARTKNEVKKLKAQKLPIADIHRKLNGSKRIQAIGGLSYPCVLRYFHLCDAA